MVAVVDKKSSKIFRILGHSAEGGNFRHRIRAVDEAQAREAAAVLRPEADTISFVGEFRDLSPAQYLAALKRQRANVQGGETLIYYDDTTTGSKETHNAWGMCSVKAEHWPNAEDHIWPDEFEHIGRVAPKHRDMTSGHRCPFDKRDRDEAAADFNGCFYSCRFFQAGPNPSREEAVKLYDHAIAEQESSGQDPDGAYVLGADYILFFRQQPLLDVYGHLFVFFEHPVQDYWTTRIGDACYDISHGGGSWWIHKQKEGEKPVVLNRRPVLAKNSEDGKAHPGGPLHFEDGLRADAAEWMILLVNYLRTGKALQEV